jgi:chromosome partitioning protein
METALSAELGEDENEDADTEAALVPGARRPEPFLQIPPCVITVAAWKGGVGKTTLAYELAYLLGAVLVDLDWDKGGATKAWGYRVEQRIKAPILDALESGRTPRPLRGNRKADLIPSHPDLGVNQPVAEKLADSLEAWCAELGRPLVVDTHPGGSPSTYGAIAAAKLMVVAAELGTKELDALEGMLEELPDYPILLVPTKVPGSPPAAEVDRLDRLAKSVNAPVAPFVSLHSWIKTRKARVALSSYPEPEPKRIGKVSKELRAVATEVAARVSA